MLTFLFSAPAKHLLTLIRSDPEGWRFTEYEAQYRLSASAVSASTAEGLRVWISNGPEYVKVYTRTSGYDKEYWRPTTCERRAIHRALLALKKSRVPSVTDYVLAIPVPAPEDTAP